MRDDRELDALLDAGRAEAPDRARHRRVRERVLMSVGSTAIVAGKTTISAAALKAASATSSTSSKGLFAWLAASTGAKVMVAAVGIGVSVSTGVLTAVLVQPPPARQFTAKSAASLPREPHAKPRTSAVAREVASEPAVQKALPTSPALVDAPQQLPLAKVTSRHERVGPVIAPEPEKQSLSSLDAEAVLLTQALRALSAHQPEHALELLAEHARRYPQGVLAPERSAARIRALCARGDVLEARSERADFARRHADSPLLRALSDCQK